ncbi:nucleoplasmin-like protein NO29 [Hibiscus syriacus]|uniref:nucleoplasmin-like protein NO29 n=1 Tax=Hibiscus syriacus TaxID=106335 RepID=UPI001921659E|nr:nucleoplasmin-like protein NO29 [Hibiscus syriacus]
MATTAAVARNLLKSSKSFPQIIRGRILGRSNAAANLNNIAKDHHQIVQSLFVSNQTIHAQIPIFDFTEMGSLVGSHRALTLEEKVGGSHRIVVEARGKVVVDDDDEFVDDEDVEFDDDEEFDAKDDDDDDYTDEDEIS